MNQGQKLLKATGMLARDIFKRIVNKEDDDGVAICIFTRGSKVFIVPVDMNAKVREHAYQESLKSENVVDFSEQ